MSLQFRVSEQVLKVDDVRDATEAVVHKYDAFLNLLCDGRYVFQREAVRTVWRFLVSDKYPNLERLARENWNANAMIQARHENDVTRFLEKLPLRAKKAASLDLATGTGKSYVMYALAAIALAEGLVDRVLVLCPSLTIEEGLLEKFTAFAGNSELAAILRELGAAVAIPGVARGNETTWKGNICVENIHAVYETTNSGIRDSFGQGKGARTLVLNDEAHHVFSNPTGQAAANTKWLQFLMNEEFGFRFIVNVTGTAYLGNDYFPDVVFRHGLKQAIEDKVVKKPDYKIAQTYKQQSWPESYEVHARNRTEYAGRLKPLTIVVTAEIARCIEVWNELVRFLMEKEHLSREVAETKVIWVTSGVPTSGDAKKRVEHIIPPSRDDGAERRRKANLAALREVDDAANPVEWIVSVAMLTEGWDVKNVFQIVPHESKAFNSKLLIAQVLGRGLRVPKGLEQPFVTINNHEKWESEIGRLLEDLLEVENVLSWGYDARRSGFLFPLHNLRYQPELQTVERKKEKARAPQIVLMPQERSTTAMSTYSETGNLSFETEQRDLYELEGAVRLLRLFLREKDEKIGKEWTPKKLREFIVAGLRAAGQEITFLSRENFLRIQQAFGPMFRDTDAEHARYSQIAKEIEPLDLTEVSRQSFSESTLKEHGGVWYVAEEPPSFSGAEVQLWEQYQEAVRLAKTKSPFVTEDAKQIAARIHQVELRQFKTPWNLHYSSHEPERKFSALLFENADLFEAFVKMPDRGGYAFPYSYKPAKAGRTHVANENFHPDYFIRLRAAHEILVVEVKAEGDDSNRNRAKCRDGERHFQTLNERLKEAGEPWRYRFYFLSPEDNTAFFKAVREGRHADWRSTLMQGLMPRGADVSL